MQLKGSPEAPATSENRRLLDLDLTLLRENLYTFWWMAQQGKYFVPAT